MSLFAIADTHLSFGTDKPMDTFEGWQNYTEKLQNNWNKIVSPADDVIIAGDISWAMNFDELKADFEFIEKLNGNKIILKGNHDYWWNTLTKMNKFLEDNGFKTIRFMHNNSFVCGGVSVCRFKRMAL
jgi:predicted phosphohydrolase